MESSNQLFIIFVTSSALTASRHMSISKPSRRDWFPCVVCKHCLGGMEWLALIVNDVSHCCQRLVYPRNIVKGDVMCSPFWHQRQLSLFKATKMGQLQLIRFDTIVFSCTVVCILLISRWEIEMIAEMIRNYK